MESRKETVGAGGTPGGVGTFLLGFALAILGGWLLTNQVTVSSGYFASGFMLPILNVHMHSFGISLIPFILGIALLFFNGRSIAGWLLMIAGLGIILGGILMTIHIHFRPTTLFNTLAMLTLLFGGIGLIVRSLKAYKAVERMEEQQTASEPQGKTS